MPSELKNEMTCIKTEVAEMKTFTQSAVKAIECLSIKLENNFQSLISDRLTSMTRQIKARNCVFQSQ